MKFSFPYTALRCTRSTQTHSLTHTAVPPEHMFGDTQMSALEDMIQAALMLRYNKRQVG